MKIPAMVESGREIVKKKAALLSESLPLAMTIREMVKKRFAVLQSSLVQLTRKVFVIKGRFFEPTGEVGKALFPVARALPLPAFAAG